MLAEALEDYDIAMLAIEQKSHINEYYEDRPRIIQDIERLYNRSYERGQIRYKCNHAENQVTTPPEYLESLGVRHPTE